MGWEEITTEIKPRLTEEGLRLLKKYNSLDTLGKHTVNTLLEMEFNRCTLPINDTRDS